MNTKTLYTVLAALVATLAILPARSASAQQAPAHLVTRWAKDVSPTNALPDYPRMQMVRTRWQNLNGTWQLAPTVTGETPPFNREIGGAILVPFPLESTLSGIGHRIPGIWYRRTFSVPGDWRRDNQRVLLHFGAVNYRSEFYVNGKQVGTHVGGYDPFTFDITDSLARGSNELLVRVENLADDTDQILGKQRNKPSGIFYTAATGIWQTVWIEPVPETYIDRLKITPDVDDQSVVVAAITIASGGPAATGIAPIKVTVFDGQNKIAEGLGGKISIPKPHLWTPENPFLYSLHVELGDGNERTQDRIDGYFAMRKVSVAKDATGRMSILLNNKPYLEVGLLDQGYWPDGIYTAPTDDALRYDIEVSKKLGFNLLRKHAKVEPDRWYYWTDKLGMLVWQDMPAGFWQNPNDAQKAAYRNELTAMINAKSNHPSIIVWTAFNEGWGEHDVPEIATYIKSLDPTRLVDNASGWTDEHCGDIADVHDYPGPKSGSPEESRAVTNGEFGGLTMRVPGHMWSNDVYGYGTTLNDSRQVTRRYQQLMQKAYQLVHDDGTCAFVYTQLTDVEQESNGMLTYDREVIKPDVDITLAANHGKFLPLPPDPAIVIPTSEEAGIEWRYAIDKPAAGWEQSGFDDSGWKTGLGGFGHEAGTIRTPWTTDDIWIRRTAAVPATVPGNMSFLVFHDEDCEIYINGVLAGSASGYNTAYQEIPMTDAGRAALKLGAPNVIAVHCHQTTGGQFIDVGIVQSGSSPH